MLEKKNEKGKIYWNVPFIREKPPQNGVTGNKPGVYMLKTPTSGLYLKAQSAK